MLSEDIEVLKSKKICSDCIGEIFLRDLVEKDSREDQCCYCGGTGSAVSLEDVAGLVEIAFERHFSRTASEPNSWQYMMLKDKETDYEWQREGEPTVYVIMNAADIPEEAACDIQEILAEKNYDFDEAAMGEEGKFSSEAHYEEIMPGDEEWQEGWRVFERTIKTEARFFSRTATDQLSNLFDTIGEMRTRHGQPLVIDAGPDSKYTHLYRSRVFQSDEGLKSAMIRPDKELCAPPAQLASAGRMNASGISVFYGATSVYTALAEARPPVGSQVAVARFEIIRPIKMLDLTALAELHDTGSIFDPAYANRLGRMMFLRKLSSRIARPVMPNDQESEFLPTQAIADFLATEGKVPLDGILYPSVQVDGTGLNVVLFHKAARCKELEFPEGAKLSANTYTTYEDGPKPDYSVTETVPKVPPKKESPDKEIYEAYYDPLDLPDIEYRALSDYDDREETLSVDLESLRVHRVNAVRFDTSDFEVTRWTAEVIGTARTSWSPRTGRKHR